MVFMQYLNNLYLYYYWFQFIFYIYKLIFCLMVFMQYLNNLYLYYYWFQFIFYIFLHVHVYFFMKIFWKTIAVMILIIPVYVVDI